MGEWCAPLGLCVRPQHLLQHPQTLDGAGDVVEEGEGVSWVTYTLTTAGPVTIEAILPGVPGMRSFRAACAPAAMLLAHSALASPPGRTTAGEPCNLIIKQHDR